MTKLEVFLVISYRVCNAVIPWVCAAVLAYAIWVYVGEEPVEEWPCITDMECERLEFLRYGKVR